MKDATQNPSTTENVRILKICSCKTVSSKSTLTYHIGCTPDGEIQLRIYSNTAAGFFSKEWLPLKTIEVTLSKGGSAFTSFALLPLFLGKSQNNTAFLLAVLLEEGLVGPSPDKKRCYQKQDADRFKAEIKTLIDSTVSLNPDDKPAKAAKKEVGNKAISTKAKSDAQETNSGKESNPEASLSGS